MFIKVSVEAGKMAQQVKNKSECVLLSLTLSYWSSINLFLNFTVDYPSKVMLV